MRTTLLALIMLTLIMPGCRDPNSAKTETETVTPTGSSSANRGSFFAIQEIGLGPQGYVALTNFTGQTASLAGLYLCQGAQCFELPDVEVAPKATVRVAVGDGVGLDKVVATEVTLGELKPSDGEIALYTSQDVKNPKAILAYLEWGSTPHENTLVAINAGLWIKGSYAPSAKDATRLFHQDTGLWLFEKK